MLDPDQAEKLRDDLLAVGQGERDALRRVYDATSGKLFALCIRITGSVGGAEDVLQETYIKVMNRASGFDPARGSAMGWLAALARNSAIDWQRARARRPTDGDAALSYISDEAESAEQRIMRKELESQVVEMLASLPVEREAEIRQTFFAGLTYSELAERDGMPIGTIKSRIRRTLLSMKKRFEDG